MLTINAIKIDHMLIFNDLIFVFAHFKFLINTVIHSEQLLSNYAESNELIIMPLLVFYGVKTYFRHLRRLVFNIHNFGNFVNLNDYVKIDFFKKMEKIDCVNIFYDLTAITTHYIFLLNVLKYKTYLASNFKESIYMPLFICYGVGKCLKYLRILSFDMYYFGNFFDDSLAKFKKIF